jgi:hypothetical protein
VPAITHAPKMNMLRVRDDPARRREQPLVLSSPAHSKRGTIGDGVSEVAAVHSDAADEAHQQHDRRRPEREARHDVAALQRDQTALRGEGAWRCASVAVGPVGDAIRASTKR